MTVELNSALNEFSHVFLTGGINFHYFAGFTGGRKSICPGLASAKRSKPRTCSRWILRSGGRKPGVRTGALDGNAVHEECERVASLVAPAFSINTIVDEEKQAVEVVLRETGDWPIAPLVTIISIISLFPIPVETRYRDRQ